MCNISIKLMQQVYCQEHEVALDNGRGNMNLQILFYVKACPFCIFPSPE